MIKQIRNIDNLGRFEEFEGTLEFGKNTILFGFNGAGKSTLSDIFYSLSKDNAEEYFSIEECRISDYVRVKEEGKIDIYFAHRISGKCI